MLHWIINPAMAINELFFGQRVPKVSLIDKTLTTTKFERSFTPCPHCNTIHDSRKWSPENKTGFRNWFGLYCTSCGGIIPCLTNCLSFIILTITFPIWGWFKDSLRARWLKAQPARYKGLDINATLNPYSKKNWVATGLSWGIIMYCLTTFIFPLASGEEILVKNIIAGIPIWGLGGLLFGFTVKKFYD